MISTVLVAMAGGRSRNNPGVDAPERDRQQHEQVARHKSDLRQVGEITPEQDHATPPMDNTAPSTAGRLMPALKKARPISKVKIGPDAVIRAMLIGLDVISARYCNAL